MPDRGQHIDSEGTALHRCIPAHHQKVVSFFVPTDRWTVHRIDWIGNNNDLSNQRFKHDLPSIVEGHHCVHVPLDGRPNLFHAFGRSAQPSCRITAVQVKDDRGLAHGCQAQFAPERPVAGRMQVNEGRTVLGHAPKIACRLSCRSKHRKAGRCMRGQHGSRPSFRWMFGQGPHDGPDATRRFARPDMDHVRHITGHAKVGHERTDGREVLKPPGRTEVRALVGVG